MPVKTLKLVYWKAMLLGDQSCFILFCSEGNIFKDRIPGRVLKREAKGERTVI